MDPRDWITYSIPEALETKAQEIRSKRDLLYPNIFTEMDTDLRWVGYLGEIIFNSWLRENGMEGFHWHENNAAGNPDFTINGIRIDVKAAKRKVPPQIQYSGQMTARHKDHPIDQLFFMSYEYLIKRIWLIGGIGLIEFLKFARYYGEGEAVHEHYIIRKGHEIYNAEYSILEAPRNWLKHLQSR